VHGRTSLKLSLNRVESQPYYDNPVNKFARMRMSVRPRRLG
jgi:hypothetical protein